MDLFNDSVFSVYINSPPERQGFAFSIPLFGPDATPYSHYFLTANHVIREAAIGQQPIELNNGKIRIPAKVLIRSSNVNEYAILTGISDTIIPPVHCITIPTLYTSTLFPAFSSLLQPPHQTNFPGKLVYAPNPSGNDLLQIEASHSFSEGIDRLKNIKEPHDIWRGTSGSPAIAFNSDGDPIGVFGVVSRLSPHGLAGRAYILSMRENCIYG